MNKTIRYTTILVLIATMSIAMFSADASKERVSHADTTWKPYIVILRNEYGQETSKWVKGYYNPNNSGDTVATGRIAKFNFTNVSQSISGWNDCVLPLNIGAGDTIHVSDAATGFSVNVMPPQYWGSYAGANARGAPADDGGGYGDFNARVDSSYWYNFKSFGPTDTFSTNFYLQNLDSTKLYKVEFVSANNNGDSLNYSAINFQLSALKSDTMIVGYLGARGASRNTSKMKFSPIIKPYPNYIDMEIGYFPNAYSGFGIVNGIIVTEYKIEQ